MDKSNKHEGVHIDSLRLRLPAGPRFAGLASQGAEAIAAEIGAALGEPGSPPPAGNHDRLRIRIREDELGASPGQIIAQAIRRQLEEGVQ